jgi:hypothetical protein
VTHPGPDSLGPDSFRPGSFHSGSFHADLDELGALATALVRTEHSLQDALTALHDTAATGIGTSLLDRACQDFQQHWGYRLGQLRQQVGDTAEGVRDTARGYRAAERGLVALFAPVPVPVPVPVAVPVPVPVSVPVPASVPVPVPGADR